MRFASGGQPAAEGRGERQPGEDGDQVGHRYVRNGRAQVAAVVADGGEIGGGGAEYRAEQAEAAGGDAGKATADAAVGAGGTEGTQVARGLAADQATDNGG